MKLKSLLLTLMTIILGSFLLSSCGCSYSEASMPLGQTVAKINEKADFTTITELRSREIGNVLNASASIKSNSVDNKMLSYRFTWFDKDGFQVGTPGPWTPISLTAGSNTQVQGTAPNPSAKTFKLNVCA